ncbi:MAG: hypothetical protein H7336_13480 [Bacteriovorax sp.]|nr:hypothetical protein [Bacteriovorax sp.]
MLGLKLRPEFAQATISGTTVSLDSKYPESFVNLPTNKALDVTYPSVDLIQALEACFGSDNRRYLVIMGERGQGKSHIMGVIHHAFKDPKTFMAWLDVWKDRLSFKFKINEPSSNFLALTVALHEQGYEFLWGPIFEHHPEGKKLEGKWEARRDTMPIPSKQDLIEAFKLKPTALILDEFQTWYANLSGKAESWAFNFVQILSEIAKEYPELLKLIVSVRDGELDAYKQLHRLNPMIVNFQSASSRQDRHKLLIHRIFENRLQIPADQIKGKIDTYFNEWCRLLQKDGADKASLQMQSVEMWPFSLDLINVMEEQILLSLNAQGTRDLIQVLVYLYKAVGESESVITPAHFGLSEDENKELDRLIAAIGTTQSRQLAKIALKNIDVVKQNLRENCPSFTDKALAALYVRSLNMSKTKGISREQIQADVSISTKIDDNQFKDQWALIFDNSYNVHEKLGKYFFDIPENARTKVLAHARNSKLFENGQDLDKILGITEWAYSPKNSVDKGRFRFCILGKNWKSQPFAEGQFRGKVPSEIGEGQACYVFIPDTLESANLKTSIGKFVTSFIPNYRNLIRFVVPTKNIFEDKAILLNARALHFADSWKEQDQEYSRLKDHYQNELQKEIASAFSEVLIISQWDHQNFQNISFETIEIDGQPSTMFSEVDEKIERDHFSIDDFKSLIMDAVKSNNIERQKLSNLRRIIEEPRPFPFAVIPWTRPTHIFDVIVDGVMNGQYAIQTNNGIVQLTTGKTPEQIRRELPSPQWNRWDSLHVIEVTGVHGGTGIPDMPTDKPTNPIQSGGWDGNAGAEASPSQAAGPSIGKLMRDLGYGRAPLQILDQLERWGVSKETKLHDVSLVFTALSGEQLRKIIQTLDSDIPESELNLKLIQEEDK